MINTGHATIKIRGKIQKNLHCYAYYPPASVKHIPFKFPRQSYDTKGLFISNLEYDHQTSFKDRKFNFENYGWIVLVGKLNLISHDEKDHFMTFKLIPAFFSLSRTTMASVPNFIEINGVNIKFPNNQESCLIHVRYLPGDEPKFINMPSPGDCPGMVVEKISKSLDGIYIKITKDIPMTIELS